MKSFVFSVLAVSLISNVASAWSTISGFEVRGDVAQDVYQALALPEISATVSSNLTESKKSNGGVECARTTYAFVSGPSVSYRCQFKMDAQVENGALKISNRSQAYEFLVKHLRPGTQPTRNFHCETEVVTGTVHGDFDGTFSVCTLRVD